MTAGIVIGASIMAGLVVIRVLVAAGRGTGD